MSQCQSAPKEREIKGTRILQRFRGTNGTWADAVIGHSQSNKKKERDRRKDKTGTRVKCQQERAGLSRPLRGNAGTGLIVAASSVFVKIHNCLDKSKRHVVFTK